MILDPNAAQLEVSHPRLPLQPFLFQSPVHLRPAAGEARLTLPQSSPSVYTTNTYPTSHVLKSPHLLLSPQPLNQTNIRKCFCMASVGNPAVKAQPSSPFSSLRLHPFNFINSGRYMIAASPKFSNKCIISFKHTNFLC